MVYKCLHGMAPSYLAADCVPATSIASRRHLRSAVSGRLAVTATNTRRGTRNFAVVAGAKIWINSLPADLRLHAQSIETFGQKLKQYLFKCHERIWGFLFCAIENLLIIAYYYFSVGNKTKCKDKDKDRDKSYETSKTCKDYNQSLPDYGTRKSETSLSYDDSR